VNTEKMVKGFGPLLPGFKQLPFGDIEAVRAAMSDKTCAVMIEPVQGEGGINVATDEFLKTLRAFCDETGTLLIFDEVQCGVARTGRLFAHEWAGVTPDIMMVAKGIGGGFPLGAVLATEKAAAGMTAGTHGSTYGGNPLGCAVGLAVMETVTDPDFLAQVNRKASLFRQKLEGLVATHPGVFAEGPGPGSHARAQMRRPERGRGEGGLRGRGHHGAGRGQRHPPAAAAHHHRGRDRRGDRPPRPRGHRRRGGLTAPSLTPAPSPGRRPFYRQTDEPFP
jgi:acetylornithine/succinyldiaminopimelate/putrescine aminotransferase